MFKTLLYVAIFNSVDVSICNEVYPNNIIRIPMQPSLNLSEIYEPSEPSLIPPEIDEPTKLSSGDEDKNLTKSATSETSHNYQVYWNVPTFMCHRYGLNFEEVKEKYQMIQNKKDEFRGDEIVILYDPGKFPKVSKNSNGSLDVHYGGVPQEGDLEEHLKHFKIDMEKQVDRNFSGLGIIDMESWRPIFRRNWGNLTEIRNYSLFVEENKNPSWNKSTVQKEAIKRFEEAARDFMEKTLKLAKQLRPRALWGYYGLPSCYNSKSEPSNWSCDKNLQSENDNLSWLWNLQDVLSPSVYVRTSLTLNDNLALIAGRIEESVRICKKYSLPAKIVPYFGYKYTLTDIYLSKDEVDIYLQTIMEKGANSYIIWGNSNDFRTKDKCKEFQNYLNDVLGPAILRNKKKFLSSKNSN